MSKRKFKVGEKILYQDNLYDDEGRIQTNKKVGTVISFDSEKVCVLGKKRSWVDTELGMQDKLSDTIFFLPHHQVLPKRKKKENTNE